MSNQPEFDWNSLDSKEKRSANKQMLASKGVFPVSRLCPTCESAEHEKVRPNRFIAFASDRVCMGCKTTYIPPTPLWAALVMFFLGLLFFAGSIVAIVLHLRSGDPLGIFATFFEGFIAFLGMLAIYQGASALIQPGKV